MTKGVKASPTLRLGSCLVVAVLALLVTGASANANKAPSIIYWSIRQVRIHDDIYVNITLAQRVLGLS